METSCQITKNNTATFPFVFPKTKLVVDVDDDDVATFVCGNKVVCCNFSGSIMKFVKEF